MFVFPLIFLHAHGKCILPIWETSEGGESFYRTDALKGRLFKAPFNVLAPVFPFFPQDWTLELICLGFIPLISSGNMANSDKSGLIVNQNEHWVQRDLAGGI